jgi:preprotein translocase subunit SecE
MADKIKLVLALVIVAIAMVAFYVFSTHSLLLRVLGLVVALIIGALIGLRTAVGSNAWAFVRGATVEARKVVWPSRKETTQITIAVVAMVGIMGLILWSFDMLLAWGIRLLTGQGG